MKRVLRILALASLLAAILVALASCAPMRPLAPEPDERFGASVPDIQSADDAFSVDDAKTEPYAGRYYYSQLSPTLQQGYRSLYSALMAHAPETWYAGDYHDDMQLVARSLFMDCPEFFYASMRGSYTGNGQSTRYDIGYEYDLAETQARLPLVNERLREAYQVAAQQPDPTSQMWALVEYLADHIDYHWEAAEAPDDIFYDNYFDTNTIYGALVDEHALCGGYSLVFEDVCYLLGIPCIYVEGEVLSDTYSGAHAWNMVQVDGRWYHVDPTWSDDEANIGLRDDYFMASDDYHNEFITGLYVPAEIPEA